MLTQLKKNNYIYYFFIFIFVFSISHAQTLSSSIELGANPNSQNYWWMKYNNFGFNDYSNYQKTKIRFNSSNFEIKLNIFSNLNELGSIFLNESYLKFNIRDNSYIRAGRYYRDYSRYLNDELSSGSILISNNAQAMPKIGVVSKKKLKKNNNIIFDFGISHAVFDQNELYDSSPFLHEKFVYINIIKSNYEFGIGFVHEAMWGGSTRLLGSQPDKIQDFLKVFISADGPYKEGEPHANALGNHLGIWDFYYKKNIGDKNIKFYYQHFFEDTSGLRFANKWDGLWGIELNNYLPRASILLEYLDTTNQNINPPYVNDAYYNHTIYTDGWSYKGYSIGNPFISHIGINPTKVFHLGINGPVFNDYFYEIKASRKSNEKDIIKYHLSIKKEILKKQMLNVFAFNNDKEIGIGLSFTNTF